MIRPVWLWIGWRDSFPAVTDFFGDSECAVDPIHTEVFLQSPLSCGQRYSGVVLCSSFQHLSDVERDDQLERMKRALRLFFAANSVQGLIYLSSAAVYGLRKSEKLLKETDGTYGTSAYAREKISLETFLRREAASYGHNVVVLRAPGLFGKSSQFTRRNGLVDRLQANTEKIEISFFGRQLRDFLHVDDLFSVIKGMMRTISVEGLSPAHEVYNVTNGEVQSVREICDQFLNRDGSLDVSYFEGEGPPHCALDGSRLSLEYEYFFKRVSDL